MAVPIYRGRDGTGFAQNNGGVDVHLSEGASPRSGYVIGCDGGRSMLGKTADIDFSGWDTTVSHLIAEIEVAREPERGLRRDADGIHSMIRSEGGSVRDIHPAVLTDRRMDAAISATQPAARHHPQRESRPPWQRQGERRRKRSGAPRSRAFGLLPKRETSRRCGRSSPLPQRWGRSRGPRRPRYATKPPGSPIPNPSDTVPRRLQGMWCVAPSMPVSASTQAQCSMIANQTWAGTSSCARKRLRLPAV